ncbi:hypothetical protein [Streptomyces sp. NPDC093111]|uniref:hypothetical protein n=1 Tax=Streptomyces sp. NPDC093111 TaxID=3154978 RepID=UPI00343A5823
MPKPSRTPAFNTPEHHLGAMALVLIVRNPEDADLRAAASLIDNATEAAWALRPDHLVPLAKEEYRQLIDYFAAPHVFDFALYLEGDRKQIRTLMEHIATQLDDALAHYPAPAQPTE